MSEKRAVGRPKKYTDKKIREICSEMNNYTEKTDIPILSEFAYTNGYRFAIFYEYDGFKDSVDHLLRKKEAQLEKLSLFHVVNPTMAIFSLKQLGWSDKQAVELSGKDGGPIDLSHSEKQQRISELLEKRNASD